MAAVREGAEGAKGGEEGREKVEEEGVSGPTGAADNIREGGLEAAELVPKCAPASKEGGDGERAEEETRDERA